MVEGSAALMHMMHSMRAQGFWKDERGVNLLDGAAHFYDTYETKDGKYVSVGSIEPQFYQLLVELSGVDASEFAPQQDPRHWPALKAKLAAVFKTRTREEWCAVMEGTDVCFAPVLSMTEAPAHPHNRARGTFLELAGVVQPAPAPRFSRSQPPVPEPPRPLGGDTDQVLREAGYTDQQLQEMRSRGVLC
jgi:alpha-methylacyl-CoA racemase